MWRIVVFFFAIGCHPVPNHAPTAAELTALPEEDAGRWLMASEPGLVALSPAAAAGATAGGTAAKTAVIAVHGYASEGTEWVTPIERMSGWGTALYFYRWNWQQCPTPAANDLSAALAGLVRDRKSVV